MSQQSRQNVFLYFAPSAVDAVMTTVYNPDVGPNEMVQFSAIPSSSISKEAESIILAPCNQGHDKPLCRRHHMNFSESLLTEGRTQSVQ